jgi:hypothetical protein
LPTAKCRSDGQSCVRAWVPGHGFAPGFRNGGYSFWAWRGSNRGARFSRNGWFWNGGGRYVGGFWYSPYAYADRGGGSGGTLVVVDAPALSVFLGAAAGAADPSPEGGCVIHKAHLPQRGPLRRRASDAGVLIEASGERPRS